MKRTINFSLSSLFVFSAWVWGAPTATEPVVSTGADVFLDYAVFYQPSREEARLEVYFAIPLGLVTAASDGGGAVYNFNVGYELKGIPDNAVVASEVIPKTAMVETEGGVRAPVSIGQFILAVNPGVYELVFGVGDPSVGQVHLTKVPIHIAPPPETGGYASDLEIASSIAPEGGEVRGEFVKNRLNVIPNPTKIINDRDPRLPVYYELYRLPVGEGAGSFTAIYDVSQTNGRRFMKTERTIEAVGADVIRVDDLDLTGVPPGRYALNLTVTRSDGAKVAAARKDFVVYHEYAPEEIAGLRNKYTPYSQEEEQQVYKELSLVGTPEELAAFRALPPEEKPLFVENFWARRDPDRNTPENEYKNAFYTRYQYAQEHFSTPFLEGIDTDRGRVYLKYGPPDQIITSPVGMPSQVDVDSSSWASEPFEAWEYLTPGGVESQYILFVFVDYDGDGSYRVESATVPGYGKLIRATGSQTGG